jgi:hypothetical protein
MSKLFKSLICKVSGSILHSNIDSESMNIPAEQATDVN